MPTQPVAPGITRFDIDERHGYMVRIRRDGNQINEYFSDKKLGGKKKALVAAKERYAQLYPFCMSNIARQLCRKQGVGFGNCPLR